MCKLRIEAFQFKGGDRSELDEERSQLGRSEWNTIVAKLASTHPSVFPTHPRNIPSGVHDMSFINLPISGMPGYRVHCVYFSHTITRTFWNVLCFAYRESDCPLRTLAAVSADDWYSIGTGLTHDSQEFSLPSADGAELSPPLPAYRSSQAIFYRFPTARGQLITSAEDNWAPCLNDAKRAPASSPCSPSTQKQSRFEWFREKKEWFKKKKRDSIVFIAGCATSITITSGWNCLKDSPLPHTSDLPTKDTDIPQSSLDEITDNAEPDSTEPLPDGAFLQDEITDNAESDSTNSL